MLGQREQLSKQGDLRTALLITLVPSLLSQHNHLLSGFAFIGVMGSQFCFLGASSTNYSMHFHLLYTFFFSIATANPSFRLNSL
jgi:hypothetical protein